MKTGKNVKVKQTYKEEINMNTSFISTKQIRDLVNEQKFTSTQDIMNCMKGMFADVLEQTLQAEMDQHLVIIMRKEEMMKEKKTIVMALLKGR